MRTGTYMYTYAPSGTSRYGTGTYLFKLDGILRSCYLDYVFQIARETRGRTGQSGLREAEMRRGPCGWIASSGEQPKRVLCQLRLQVFIYGTLPST
jgi:hypothetical protein